MSNHQIVILAAGSSSRFYPFNTVNKSLFVVCGRPIIAYTLESVKTAGFHEAIVVTGPDQKDRDTITSFTPKGLAITYTILEKPAGQGAALLAARAHIKGNFFLINSQQLKFHEQIKPHLNKFDRADFFGAVLRMHTDSPEKYGIFHLEGDRVLELIEKPSKDQAPSNWKLVGTYFFTPEFLEILSNTPAQEYSLEAAINTVIAQGKFQAFESTIDYPSLKYPWDLFDVKDHIFSTLKPSISKSAKIAATAIIRGQVTIEDGALIGDFAIVEGPAYLGKNAVVGTYSQVRAGSVLEAGAQAERYCDVRGSLIGPNTHIHSQLVADSILGSNIRIGGGFVSASKRIDRQNVQVLVKGRLVDTGRNNIGVFVGNDTHIGVNASVMPGTVIGPHSILYPGITLKGTHEADKKITNSNL